MSYRTFMLLRIVIVIIMAGLIAWAVANGNALIPIPVAIAALVILLLFRRGVKEVVVDERIHSIADKAAQKAFRIFGILAAITGATLVAISKGISTVLLNIGLTLAYSACALALLYYIFYTYYNRKFGGKE